MVHRSAAQLRADALAIWQAGVDAVDSERLVRENLCTNHDCLEVGDLALPLAGVGRIAIVGAGKAGAGMAAGAIAALGDKVCREKRVLGWINVPQDCVRPLPYVHLHGARPAGLNEPMPAGVAGAEEILRIVSQLSADDVCICLLSGGGSALLPLPVEHVPLEEKQALTKALSGAGANIQQLNTVRKQLSRIKGGGLARACRAGHLVTLIISDVIGDPLDTIASGPTVYDPSSRAEALDILEQLRVPPDVAPAAFQYLRQTERHATRQTIPSGPQVHHLVIGNNAVAVDAAGIEAERRGYSHAMHVATQFEGPAEEVGQHLARMAIQMRDTPGPDCLITGGEPTVRLAPKEKRGQGGRNQQLVLAAYAELLARAGAGENPCQALALLSGGTDGEDGPTDAAGALIDADIAETLIQQSLDPRDHLDRNDAYPFFEQAQALLKTGPTHTNVCDVRVVVVSQL